MGDTVRHLQLVDIADEGLGIRCADLGLGQHAAETPMMLADAFFQGKRKGAVGVMSGLIDLVCQWRPARSAAGILALQPHRR